MKNCTICAAKSKALISFAVTAKLICTFVLPIQIVGFSMPQPKHAQNDLDPLTLSKVNLLKVNLNDEISIFICELFACFNSL